MVLNCIQKYQQKGFILLFHPVQLHPEYLVVEQQTSLICAENLPIEIDLKCNFEMKFPAWTNVTILLQNSLMLRTCSKKQKTKMLLFLKHQYCNHAHFLWSVVIMIQPCQY